MFFVGKIIYFSIAQSDNAPGLPLYQFTSCPAVPIRMTDWRRRRVPVTERGGEGEGEPGRGNFWLTFLLFNLPTVRFTVRVVIAKFSTLDRLSTTGQCRFLLLSLSAYIFAGFISCRHKKLIGKRLRSLSGRPDG